ncbi:2-oxoacid ferredoxin oxidoreductase [Mycolicibacterium novocastrense]|uniref:indolepyruvate ferredoxin oxidoreductase family protein n=1 Tax=Mycolicibacterium novocastrense TaxID=59813 RepID=UPI000749A8DC|nr:indolepyruvate ferredoxin oxidoreductase family protein [Mycolicibacterium novocastrense]KUH67488.1 2-oxoacid ferredoxin oxidoreductase [Mycolicibacterium novocastrense]KUH68209.1 2-oxoacid ferredoxin oxidoreductase [Mycolicibacterium novocastrense]KUH74457.1 2-oxoacid ferredoxin oxidoreductase [Mycolicibacterium novocastrense]
MPKSAASVDVSREEFSLEDRYHRATGTVYLSGVQSLVRILFDRAVVDRTHDLRTSTFVSGYEGSPLAGYDLELVRRSALLRQHDIVHRPGLNEELAATAVMGSQLATQVGRSDREGVTGIWYGKSPGVDRASDALRHANLVGTGPKGGAVALVGDDAAAKSSSVPCASEGTLADLAMPTLYPADSQDVLDLGLHAQFLSRCSGLWTGVKIATAVADAASTAVIARDRVHVIDADLGPNPHRPSSMLLGENLMALERSLHDVRIPRALEYARLNALNNIVQRTSSDRIGILAAGKTYLDVREALRAMGLSDRDLARHGIRLLKLGMIFPLENEIIREFAAGIDELIVVEEKRPFLEGAVKEILYGRVGAPVIVGKTDRDGTSLFSRSGELDTDSVASGLSKVLARLNIEAAVAWRRRPTDSTKLSLPLLVRSPYYCSGCPHNTSTTATAGSLVGAGIGCHSMVVFMDPAQVGTIVGMTQMGGEGAQWLGIEPFVDDEHFVQNIGDGTFMHSGSLAVRAAVAAGVNVTYKLLYNGSVAMTGGQDVVGALPVDRLAAMLIEEGVAKVIITTENRRRILRSRLPKSVKVLDRSEIDSALTDLKATPGVTVLIHDQECAAEKRRARRRGKAETPNSRVVINERICEGCGDCGRKSNCLSVHPVSTEFGRKTQIDQSSCNLDYSCLEGDCPAFMTIIPSAKRVRQHIPVLDATSLCEPTKSVRASSFAMRITGIGGTGIVTLSQILATAAVIDGNHARSLDQTGLAQKGGAVVSDIKITDSPLEQAAKLSSRSCDLYLSCDPLVATDPKYLSVAAPERTAAVMTTNEVPTGQMVVDTTIGFPPSETVHHAITSVTRQVIAVDAGSLAMQLFDDEQYANILLVGAAYQGGLLPIAAEAIEKAISLNGVAVEQNIQAFRRGRQAIDSPDTLRAALGRLHEPPMAHAVSTEVAEMVATVTADPTQELHRLLTLRVADLIQYQNSRYARSYVDFVRTTLAAESANAYGSTSVTEAVARYLYKLMAFKDEYEVARLALEPAVDEQVAATFGPDSRIRYRLHPPVLRAAGMKQKISLGGWFRPVLRVLRAMRRTRGTALDVFGYQHMRRLERDLITEYRESVTAALAHLTNQNLALVCKLAELPDMIRGYEDVKLSNVAKYREEQTAVLHALLVGTVGEPLPAT